MAAPDIDGVLVPLSHREGPRDLRTHAQAAPSNALVIQARTALSLCFQKQIPAPALRKFPGNPLEPGDNSAGNPQEPGDLTGTSLPSTKLSWDPGGQRVRSQLLPQCHKACSRSLLLFHKPLQPSSWRIYCRNWPGGILYQDFTQKHEKYHLFFCFCFCFFFPDCLSNKRNVNSPEPSRSPEPSMSGHLNGVICFLPFSLVLSTF